MKRYDAIIIGFGKGGKTLAAELADKGWKVAMIEQSADMYGGSCINVACIPTKNMIHFARMSECRQPLSFAQQSVLYRDAVEATQRLTADMRRANLDRLMATGNVTLYNGHARFVSSHELAVTTEQGEEHLGSVKIFINTGSVPVIPPLTGAGESRRVYTSEQLLKVRELPRRLVIVGGGYVGLEFATMYTLFGSQVTVLDNHPKLLPNDDDDIAYYMRKNLEGQQIMLHENVLAQSVHDRENDAVVSYVNLTTEQMHEIEADAVLLATGRRPYTEGLGLEEAGIKVTDRGAIEVNQHLETSVPNIWALGDVKGGPMFTYISLDDFRVVNDDIFGKGKLTTRDREPIPTTVFTEPPLAKVGLGEEEAFRAGCNIKVAKLAAAEIGRARTLGQPEGLMKVVVNADTNRLIGCTFFCAEANEIINLAALAIHAGLDYRVLRDQVFTHPSMSEAFNKLLSLID